jgi:DNA (cytosine-5)-methyltransferase 1
MAAYYNEHDPFAAAWLRELIKAGHIAPGDVDERSIEDVCPDDLRPYRQCHFFAGIGVWSYALRRAGWDDDRAIWTGSCPCQPFSVAGKSGGFDDERHLWPAMFHLVTQCDPPIVIGEQVASKDGLAWLDLVRSDMEGAGRAFAAVDLCAAGVGAPHIRQRLWWVGMDDAASARHEPEGSGQSKQPQGRGRVPSVGCESGGLADDDDDDARLEGRSRAERSFLGSNGQATTLRASNGVAGANGGNASAKREQRLQSSNSGAVDDGRPGPINGFWRDADWLFCRDGKWRPVEPGTFPLAHGAPNRVGRLRGYGNAIVAPVAQAFIEAVISIL